MPRESKEVKAAREEVAKREREVARAISRYGDAHVRLSEARGSKADPRAVYKLAKGRYEP